MLENTPTVKNVKDAATGRAQVCREWLKQWSGRNKSKGCSRIHQQFKKINFFLFELIKKTARLTHMQRACRNGFELETLTHYLNRSNGNHLVKIDLVWPISLKVVHVISISLLNWLSIMFLFNNSIPNWIEL